MPLLGDGHRRPNFRSGPLQHCTELCRGGGLISTGGEGPRATVTAWSTNGVLIHEGRTNSSQKFNTVIDHKLKDLRQLDSNRVVTASLYMPLPGSWFLSFYVKNASTFKIWLTKVANICVCPTNSPETYYISFYILWLFERLQIIIISKISHSSTHQISIL